MILMIPTDILFRDFSMIRNMAHQMDWLPYVRRVTAQEREYFRSRPDGTTLLDIAKAHCGPALVKKEESTRRSADGAIHRDTDCGFPDDDADFPTKEEATGVFQSGTYTDVPLLIPLHRYYVPAKSTFSSGAGSQGVGAASQGSGRANTRTNFSTSYQVDIVTPASSPADPRIIPPPQSEDQVSSERVIQPLQGAVAQFIDGIRQHPVASAPVPQIFPPAS
jgi:hypothetical protein